MDLRNTIDDFRYNQRLKDATEHSHNLLGLLPAKRPNSPLSFSDPGKQDHPESKQDFLNMLQKMNRAEYGESEAQLTTTNQSKLSHSQQMRSQNLEIGRRLQQVFMNSKRKSQKLGHMDERTLNRKALLASTPTFRGLNNSKKTQDLNSQEGYRLKHHDEIEELENKLREQRLSWSRQDHLFYDRLAQRETNVVVDQTIYNLLSQVCKEAFQEAERAARAARGLSEEEQAIVEDALHAGPMNEVLISKYNVDITRGHLQCLLPMTWLNDEVINFWFQLMADRDTAMVEKGLVEKKSHFFNSFFYTKVSEGGYNFINVRRWTRKIDIFAMDKIFIPVNLSNTHWCLAVIFMTEKKIQYFDSMHGSGLNCLQILLRYLHDEMEHKKKEKFDEEYWQLITTTPDTPQQQNGSDCGVFTCTFADYISQNFALTFKQREMVYHRQRMVLGIAQGELPLPEEE